MDATEKRQALGGIARRVAGCADCGLCRGRTNAVPGEGYADADIMFIGEGPGFYEDQQGRPFVGASGKFLDELLAGIGLDRKKVFVTNVVKCRPPDNRDPQPDEIEACGKYMVEQIAVIEPKVVVTLGRHSMQRYFPGEAIGRVHGQPRRKGDLIVVPMYHPAAALHQGSLRKVIEADFKKLPDFLSRIISGLEGPARSAGYVVAEGNAERAALVPAHLRAAAAQESEPVRTPTDGAAETTKADPQQMRLL